LSGIARQRGGERSGDWPADVARARTLVLAHGWNATAYQIVNPGIAHWFARDGDAVVGYVRHARVRVVAGAPVCALERLGAVVEEFERASAAAGDSVCYFGAEARLEGVLGASAEHRRIALGAQPAWHPAGFAERVQARSSLRAQLNRARNKGVTVGEWPARVACGAPALRRVLREWLDTRGLPPLHFLIEPETLDRLDDRRVFVAERAGEVVGFVITSPVPARHGWLVEQFVRGRAAVNGTTELMLDAAVTAMATDGADYVTLGLAPLSRHGPTVDESPWWVRLLLRWLRAHGRRFYNFDGLDAFKTKFAPERWEPVYAIARGRSFPPRALWAITGAFGGRSPVTLAAHSLARAAAQEARWLRSRLRATPRVGAD
jgi:phosphatidylglycerol lysyltransferase